MGSPPPEIDGGGASVERLAVAEVLVAEAQDQSKVSASRDLLLAARLVVPHVLLGAAALHHCKNETGETVSVLTPPCVSHFVPSTLRQEFQQLVSEKCSSDV